MAKNKYVIKYTSTCVEQFSSILEYFIHKLNIICSHLACKYTTRGVSKLETSSNFNTILTQNKTCTNFTAGTGVDFYWFKQ